MFYYYYYVQSVRVREAGYPTRSCWLAVKSIKLASLPLQMNSLTLQWVNGERCSCAAVAACINPNKYINKCDTLQKPAAPSCLVVHWPCIPACNKKEYQKKINIKDVHKIRYPIFCSPPCHHAFDSCIIKSGCSMATLDVKISRKGSVWPTQDRDQQVINDPLL